MFAGMEISLPKRKKKQRQRKKSCLGFMTLKIMTQIKFFELVKNLSSKLLLKGAA